MLQKQCLKKIEPNMGIPVICVLLSRMRMDVIPLRNVYVAVATTSTCDGCAFEEDEFCRVRMPSCDSDKRSDGRNVIFVEVPKPEPKPKTNADRIREMSNEDLADFLNDMTDCSSCATAIHNFCHANEHENCNAVILQWLNRPAEEESENQ